jgi:hypothetical protein
MILYNNFFLKKRIFRHGADFEKLDNIFLLIVFCVNFGKFYRFFHIENLRSLKGGGKDEALL